MLLVGEDIYRFHFVSQGKTTIPSMDDGEEMALTDVRYFEPESRLTHSEKIKKIVVILS